MKKLEKSLYLKGFRISDGYYTDTIEMTLRTT